MSRQTRKRTRIAVLLAVAGAVAVTAGVAQAGVRHHATKRASLAQLEQRVGWESYWYSLYNLSALSMGKSGMGIQFTAPKAKLMAVLKAAGLSKPPLTNPYFVSVPYSSGDPHFMRAWNANDGATWRWNPKSFDTTITPQSYAWTATKYSEWAKNFENHTAPSSLDHFRGLMLNNLAATAAGWMEQNLRLPNGLFASAWKNGHVTDATPKLRDQLAVLIALGSLETVADPADHFAWYTAPLPVTRVRGMEDHLFTALRRSALVKSPSFADRALGVEALSWYASTTRDAAARTQAASLALTWAKGLRASQSTRGAVTAAGLTPLDAQALFVRAEGQASLVAAAVKQSGEAKAAHAAAVTAWNYLNSHYWDAKAGLYLPAPGRTTQSYAAGLVADLTGALNVAQHVLHAKGAAGRYAVFFVHAVDHSRLLASQLPFTAGQHNGLPLPPKAGGTYGIAPVFLSSVAYDTANGSWKVTNGRFTTAAALELSDEMFWMGAWAGQQVKGRPALGLPYLHG